MTAPASSAPEPRPFLFWGGACVLAVVFVVHAYLIGCIADDGLISLQYVKHFLLGDGLVYNADERVEGYTNFLWIALLGVSMKLAPILDLVSLARGLGLAFGVATLFGVCHFSRRVCGEHGAWGLLAGAFLAFHTSFVGWSTSGLETVMFAALLFAAAYAYVDYLNTGARFWLPALLFACVPMIRPDGLLFAALTGLHFVCWEWRRSGKLPFARAAIWAGIVFAIVGAFVLWRYDYYGELLPNTFYAKVVGGDSQYRIGWRYVRGYFAMHGALVFVPVAWLLARRAREAWQDYFALLLGAYLLYVISVGGDGLQFYRFFAHVAPLLYLLVQSGWSGLARAARGRADGRVGLYRAIAVGLVLVALVYTGRHGGRFIFFPERYAWTEPHSEMTFPGDGTVHDYLWFENYFVDRQAAAARWLDENAAPDSLVASTPAGAIAYYSRHRVIDMLGLNDHHIARTEPGNIGFPRAGHMKGDGAYVLSRAPDYILMGNVAVLGFPLDEAKMKEKLVRKSEHELWANPDFHRDYELKSVRLNDAGPFQYFTFYQRRAPRPAAAAPPPS